MRELRLSFSGSIVNCESKLNNIMHQKVVFCMFPPIWVKVMSQKLSALTTEHQIFNITVIVS